jgi:hypothetical protein
VTTPRQFAQALLVGLGFPLSDENVRALIAAQKIEAGFMHNAAAFNPLNTSQPMPGSTIAVHLTPTFGPRAYVNWEQGLSATLKTLTNGHYATILAALARSAPADETLQVWDVSPWGWWDPKSGKTNPVGPASLYQGEADTPFPAGGGSLGSGGLGLLLVGGLAYGAWRLFGHRFGL